MYDYRVPVEFAVHGMGRLAVGDGIKNDRKIIVRRVKLSRGNQQLQPVVADGDLLPLELDNHIAVIIGRLVYDRVLFIRKQQDAVSHGEPFKVPICFFPKTLQAAGGNPHGFPYRFRP